MSDFRSCAVPLAGIMGRVLDHATCYRAVQSRDARFDGRFVTAVATTGIYCRPSCPAVTPKRGNVRFFPSAAAAQQHGFRACKRCRPDATPGSPEWNIRGDVVARVMRLVGDGVVDREGVRGLARHVAYSERQLNRLVTDELGAGPLALARAQRAETARTLIETSDLEFTAIAFAAGFGSVRQFNDTVRAVFGSTPTQLRAAATSRRRPSTPGGGIELDLAVRQPFDAAALFAFLAARAVPGVERWDGDAFHRALDLPHGHGVAVLRAAQRSPSQPIVRAHLRVQDWRDVGPAVQRLRRLLDLDADPVAVDDALADDPVLRPLVAAAPGRRVPGSVDPFETAVRAVVGQQISVAGARTVTGRIVGTLGAPIAVDSAAVTHVFPTPDRLAAAAAADLPMPASRARTIHELAARAADGRLVLGRGADRDDVAESLLAVPGVGPWTVGYVLMRGLGDPDVFLAIDLGVRAALDHLGIGADRVGRADRADRVDRADRWRPWRSYAVHHLWSVAATGRPSRPALVNGAH